MASRSCAVATDKVMNGCSTGSMAFGEICPLCNDTFMRATISDPRTMRKIDKNSADISLINPARMHRREFAKAVAALSFGLVTSAPAASAPPKWRAAVIGSTGHGDYGHGLETI